MVGKKKFTRKKLDEAMDAAIKKFSHRSNVTGFDVGYRWHSGEPTDEVCVRVHVQQKIPVPELEASEIFPEEIEGIPLDVIQGPYRVMRSSRAGDHRKKFKALVGGISCGRPDCGTGTLATVVVDLENGRPAILSNWHVLAGPSALSGDPILQPGPGDLLPHPGNVVARLSRAILDRDGDAAIAELNGSRSWLPIQFATNLMPEEMRESRLGETLQKSGRSTGLTRGRVDGEGFYRIKYEVRPGIQETRDIRGFKIVTEKPGNPGNEELSSSGDSGSLWVSADGREAVGLHFAGESDSSPAAEHAIACNMTAVADRLKFRLATFDDLLEVAEPQTEPAQGLASEASSHGGPFPGTRSSGGPWEGYEPSYDWWRGRNRGRWERFAESGRPAHGALRGGAYKRLARAEHLGRHGVVSIRHYIWPRLKRALVARSDVFVNLERGHVFKDYLSSRRAKAFIVAAVNGYGEFQRDRIVAGSHDFRGDTTFEQAAVSLGNIYSELGYTVEA